jgi:hypothetical protein
MCDSTDVVRQGASGSRDRARAWDLPDLGSERICPQSENPDRKLSVKLQLAPCQGVRQPRGLNL